MIIENDGFNTNMPKVKSHILNGIKYEIDVDEPYLGLIDNRLVKRITLPNGLATGNGKKAKSDLMTLLHECFHAEDWNLTEKRVEQMATDIGTLLWRLGYRRSKQKVNK